MPSLESFSVGIADVLFPLPLISTCASYASNSTDSVQSLGRINHVAFAVQRAELRGRAE